MNKNEFLKKFLEFAEDKDIDTQEKQNALFNEFIRLNGIPFGMDDADDEPDVFEYLELAEDAETPEEAMEYVNKALDIEPDNIDAQAAMVVFSSSSSEEMLGKYSDLIAKATEQLEAEGLFSEDCIGEFWLLLETRPYMRLRHSYLELLVVCGRMRMAVDECVELLKLCEGDNLGIRFTLMHLYAYFEDKDSAKKLLNLQNNRQESIMLLPMSILCYKRGDLKEAQTYLEDLSRLNKGTTDFIECFLSGDFDEIEDDMLSIGYRPYTAEELLTGFKENLYLYATASAYMEWAHGLLQKGNKGAKRSSSAKAPVVSITAERDEQRILELIDSKGYISRSDVDELLGVSQSTSINIINHMISNGSICKLGSGRKTRYTRK